MSDYYFLFESPSGYALFKSTEFDELNDTLEATVTDSKSFSKQLKLASFLPFTTAEEALEEIQAISEGQLSKALQGFLEQNLPADKKSFKLAVLDSKLGESISATKLKIQLAMSASTRACFRLIRLHFQYLVRKLIEDAKFIEQAQVGLSHQFSRSKIQFDPKRQDKPILNTSALLDSIDKNINTFIMRVKEWYGWHFPELAKLVGENLIYCRLVGFIGIKEEAKLEEKLEQLTEIVGSEEVAAQIVKAASHSMGTNITKLDLQNILSFAEQCVKLYEMKLHLQTYLKEKMEIVAPNMTALLGETISARLLSHSGSLVSLAKSPASTIQILGAEKALFRALKAKENTPKYGILFNASAVSRAVGKEKGRLARYVANKVSIASRIDAFQDDAAAGSAVYGEMMKEQVEERLAKMDSTTKVRKNSAVMEECKAEREKLVKKLEKKRKRKSEPVEPVEEEAEVAPVVQEKPKKKKSRQE
jgi:nucleolar protein 56